MDQLDDAAVIAQALRGQLTLMRGVENAHRRLARTMPKHPEAFRTTDESITRAAAHTARCAAYSSRADFLQELSQFPRDGLHLIGARDLAALRVREHIGAPAAPKALRHKTLPAPPARPQPQWPPTDQLPVVDAESAGAAAAPTPEPLPAVTDRPLAPTTGKRSLWETFLRRRNSRG